ncbi:MAG: FG-GAP-like repeat-containing protein [Capsulimonadales bacterium]|nr:FG-GAP-like repeat-containing protein [Capsulimonadales bacterium]
MNLPDRYPARLSSTMGFLALLPLLAGCPGGNGSGNGGTTISAGSPKYAELAGAFSRAVVALEVDGQQAADWVPQVTTIAPDEPAGWANLGLFQLRKGRPEEAIVSLNKAQQLAPQNSVILANLGLAETRRGNFVEAIAALRKAIAIDPNDVRAMYALYKAIEQQGGADAGTEGDKLLAAILEKQPGNLAAILERTRLAARRGDQATARAGVAALTERSAAWPAPYRNQLTALGKAVEANIRAAAPEAIRMGNFLKQTVEYRIGLQAIEGSATEVGQLVRQLIKYPPVVSTPAEPDTGLTYTVEPADAEGKGGFVRAVFPTGEGTPIVRAAASAFTTIDFDYDFQTDLVSVGTNGLSLLRGQDGKFVDVTAKMKLPPTVTKKAYSGAWVADIDLDGDPDIVPGAKDGAVILRNNGDGTFKTLRPFPDLTGITGFAWGDLDNDGDPDAVVIDGAGRMRVYSNERNGLFVARPLPGGLENVATVTIADTDRDGRFDIVARKSDGRVVAIREEAEGKAFAVTDLVRTTAAADGSVLVADADNNGGNDLILSDGKGTEVFLSDARGAFPATATATVALATRDVADLNGDGRLDLIGTANGQPTRAVSKGTKEYGYLVVRPRAAEKGKATGDRRINSFGIGGEIAVRSGLVTQKQRIEAPVVHFGLGEGKQAQYVRIVWPNGYVQGEFDTDARTRKPIDAGMTLVAEQRLVTSCPFLFAWDGERMSFVTDCIWRSPLGLKINAQGTSDVAMTEDWVKIRGDQLKPRNDEEGRPYYDLRITADLWETHFFDHLALMTVDHPKGTDIWVDERFAIPPPPLSVIVTRPPTPVKATADTGEDMTGTIRARDGVHADYFGRGKYQGVTRDHALTLDLGKAATVGTGPLYLIANGWIHPTNSSINVALSQGGDTPPTGLSLEVPDGKGGWKTAKAGLGFPTGKVKTVVLRVDDILKGGTRLRLRTNLEIFWDSIGVARGVPNAPVGKMKQVAGTAELGYRGFTTITAVDKSSPELPVGYEPVVSRRQRWRSLEGFHTRFGDVRELLTRIDDRYIIMGPGDEIRMRFAVPPPPKPGYVRDFILIGDGWVKDGDLNTTFSKTVLPLPTHADPKYDRRPTTLEEDPVYRKRRSDWETFHTRFVSTEEFRDTLWEK